MTASDWSCGVGSRGGRCSPYQNWGSAVELQPDYFENSAFYKILSEIDSANLILILCH